MPIKEIDYIISPVILNIAHLFSESTHIMIQPYPIWDLNTVLFLQQHLSGFVIFFKLISVVFSPPVVFIIAYLYFIFGSKNRYDFLIFCVLGIFLAISLKDTIHQPRPYWSSPFVLGLIHPRDYGMPSGHALFGVFYIWLGQKFKIQRLGICLGLFAFVLVCISRMVLGAHFLTQILVGSFLGVSCIVVSIVTRKLLNYLSFKTQCVFLLIYFSLILAVIFYLFGYYALYFEPRQEWLELIHQYTPHDIIPVSFEHVLSVFLLMIFSILALIFENHFIHFEFQKISTKPFLFASLIGGSYLIPLIVILLGVYHFSHDMALIVASILTPVIGLFFFPLEGFVLGILSKKSSYSGQIQKLSIAYWLGWGKI